LTTVSPVSAIVDSTKLEPMKPARRHEQHRPIISFCCIILRRAGHFSLAPTGSRFTSCCVPALCSRGPRLAGIAAHVGLMDMPGGRKQHPEPVPVIGGIAMFFASPRRRWIGLVVDPILRSSRARPPGGRRRRGRHARHHAARQFFIQLIAALFMTSWAGVYVSSLDLFSVRPATLYNWAIPFSVVCALGVINAINMVDGLDGSAAGSRSSRRCGSPSRPTCSAWARRPCCFSCWRPPSPGF